MSLVAMVAASTSKRKVTLGEALPPPVDTVKEPAVMLVGAYVVMVCMVG